MDSPRLGFTPRGCATQCVASDASAAGVMMPASDQHAAPTAIGQVRLLGSRLGCADHGSALRWHALLGAIHHEYDLNALWDSLRVHEICVRTRAFCSRFEGLEHCLALFAVARICALGDHNWACGLWLLWPKGPIPKATIGGKTFFETGPEGYHSGNTIF